MEIKDVTKLTAVESVINLAGDKTSDRAPTEATPVKEKIETSAEPDVVAVTHHAASSEVNEARLKNNAVIGTVNYVVESTNQIGKVLKSVSGLVEQAETLPESVAKKLEEEGAELIKEIERIARSPLPDGSAIYSKDKIRYEIEKSIGQALDIIFPSDAADGFGLHKLELSKKESIILTRSAVAKAQAQYESLRENVTRAADKVKALTTASEEAAKTKNPRPAVRVVDEAQRLTSDTTVAIGENPKRAIESFGEADAFVLR